MAKSFYSVVTFDANFFGDVKGEYSLVFKADGGVSDGSIFLVQVTTKEGDDRFLVVDQYKISQNKRTMELVRGFANPSDAEGFNLKDLGSVKTFAELREEAGITKVDELKYLGKVPEDTTTHASDANIWFVKVTSPLADRELEAAEATSKLQFLSRQQFFDALFYGKINDMDSNSAFFRAVCGDNELGDQFAKYLLSSDAEAVPV